MLWEHFGVITIDQDRTLSPCAILNSSLEVGRYRHLCNDLMYQVHDNDYDYGDNANSVAVAGRNGGRRCCGK